MAMDVQGKRVVVTAGGGGIGLAIVEALVAGGAKVHTCDVDARSLESCASRLGVGTTVCDVSNEADVGRLFVDARESLGGLDALVNNAGIAGPTGAVEDIDPKEWRRCIDIDLTGQFLCARCAVPLLKANGGGAIVNMSSSAGRHGYAFRTPYSSAKWGVIGLTQSLAKELGPFGISVNAILPGIVEGPRMEGVIKARAEQVGVSYEEMKTKYLERVSMRRMVSPKDVANMAVFLIAPAGANVSGQSLGVCGNVETL